MKRTDCMSSKMNACQAIMKPDSSKSATNKSTGIKKGLARVLLSCNNDNGPVTKDTWTEFEKGGLILLDQVKFPDVLRLCASVCTSEFAGVKFKEKNISTGTAYVKFADKCIITPILTNLPKVRHSIICEEKYSFTPDDFKAAIRKSRAKTHQESLAHLQEEHDILSDGKYSQVAIRGSLRGKKLVSSFLASYVTELNIRRDICIDVDSELAMSVCECADRETCKCLRHAIPIRTKFSSKGFVEQSFLGHIHQRKGEAEMSQADWLVELKDEMVDGECAISLVTSGDIDAVPIHLVAVSRHWPRKDDGSFIWPLYIVLQKSNGRMDIFQITLIIQLLEAKWKDNLIALKTAIGLCMGGNDFLPRYFGYNHEKLIKLMLSPNILENIFNVDQTSSLTSDMPIHIIQICNEKFLELMKTLYCPSSLQSRNLTFDEVRQISVKRPDDNKKDIDAIKHPQTWLPPKSALLKIACLINSQIQYLLTLCQHDASLPIFLENGGLQKINGIIQYDLGPDCHVTSPNELLVLEEQQLFTRIGDVQKSTTHKKRQIDVTPRRLPPMKKRPIHSTPRYINTL